MAKRGATSDDSPGTGAPHRGWRHYWPLLFGLALQFTGSYRTAILSLVVFFAVGLLVLGFVDVEKGAREAGVSER